MARECVEDLAEDGVIYAEVRFAPELHTEAGLHLEPVVEAVLAGFADGMDQARAAGRPIVVAGVAYRYAYRGPLARDRRAGRAVPGRRGGRL